MRARRPSISGARCRSRGRRRGAGEARPLVPALYADRHGLGRGAGADGLFLDVEGSAHLFGGEAGLIADLAARLALFGLEARLAIASTAGAAWAVSHYARDRSQILKPGEEASALRDLPLAALRLPDETRALLRRLGLRRVGQVMSEPRGAAHGPLWPASSPPPRPGARAGVGTARRRWCRLPAIRRAPASSSRSRARSMSPIAARRLLGEVIGQLARDGRGARRLRLLLFRVMSKTCIPHDNHVLSLDIGLAAPSRDVCAHGAAHRAPPRAPARRPRRRLRLRGGGAARARRRAHGGSSGRARDRRGRRGGGSRRNGPRAADRQARASPRRRCRALDRPRREPHPGARRGGARCRRWSVVRLAGRPCSRQRPPAPFAAASGRGGGDGAHSRRAAAAVPLARRRCIRSPPPRAPSASRPNGGARIRASGSATTTWSRTRTAGASGSSAPDATARTPMRPPGSCMGCWRECRPPA